LKRKPKTSPLSDTDNNFKFSKGDFVSVDTGKIKRSSKYIKIPHDGKWTFTFTGKVVGMEKGSKEHIYIVECYSSNLRFPESILRHQNSDDERDWKLKQLLNKKESQ
jgi:hypothetical protein